MVPIKGMEVNPNTKATVLGVAVGVLGIAGWLVFGERAPHIEVPAQPVPVPEVCVNATDPKWCTVQEELKRIFGANVRF